MKCTMGPLPNLRSHKMIYEARISAPIQILLTKIVINLHMIYESKNV